MAMRKEPERRYASAEQFADDLERYHEGLPVRAHRRLGNVPNDPNLSTGMREVLSVGAVLVSALVAGIMGITTGLILTRRERESRRDLVPPGTARLSISSFPESARRSSSTSPAYTHFARHCSRMRSDSTKIF